MTHECMMPTCARRADAQWAICGPCWRMLPEDKRMAISRAFSPMAAQITIGLERAIADAHAWLMATFAGQVKEHDRGRWERLVRIVREKDAARARRRASEPESAKPPHLRSVP